MSEWHNYSLGELINVKHGYAFPGEFITPEPTPNVLVTPGNFHIGGGFKHDKYKYFRGDYPESYLLKAGDIVVTMTDLSQETDTLGFSAKIPNKKGIKFLHNQRIGLLEFISDDADKDFIYWLLRTNQYQGFIVGASSGTSIRHTSPKFIKEYKFKLPPPEEQKAIASVLSSLDDKIDLLHRQNTTLERMAETLFRQWFVEDAQDDWEQGTLENLIETANTGLDAIQRAPIVDFDTGVKCLRIQDITQNKKYENWANSKVLEKDFEKARLKKDDLIMARTCSPGIIFLAREDLNAVFNNGLARIRPNKNKTYSIFLYYLFKTEDFIGHIYGISGGTSVQLNMKLGDLLSYKVAFPPKESQDKYYPYFESIDNKIFKNQQQIQTLEKLRDNLLPKLMSGEIRVLDNE